MAKESENNKTSNNNKQRVNRKKQEQRKQEELKQKQEEERKEREKQEKIKREQEEKERRKKEREDRIQQLKENIDELHKKLKEFYKEKQNKRQTRLQLQQDITSRPTASVLKSLDSGIKRNTAFIKKLKQVITDDNIEHLCKEIKALNLTRYVSEVVAAIVDFKPKCSISALTRICILMHSRYADFTSDLIPKLQKLIEVPSSFENDQEKKYFYNRKKEVLKLFAELFLYGVILDDSILFSTISDHVNNAKKEFQDDDLCIYGLILEITWSRLAANEFMGLYPITFHQIIQAEQQLDETVAIDLDEKVETESVKEEQTKPEKKDEEIQNNENEDNKNEEKEEEDNEETKKQKAEEEKQKKAEQLKQQRINELQKTVEELDQTISLISQDRKQQYLNLALKYFDMISKHIIILHKKLREVERENIKIVNLKGELTEKRSESYDKQLKSHDRLLNGVNSFAELINKEPPTMPEEDYSTRITGDIGLADLSRLQAQNEEDGIFGDEDTRSFYEDIKPLREMLPPAFFDTNTSKPSSDTLPANINTIKNDKEEEEEEEEEEDKKQKQNEGGEEAEKTSTTNTKNVADNNDEIINEKSPNNDEIINETNETNQQQLDIEYTEKQQKPTIGGKLEEFVKELPKCVNRELIDRAAMDFCYIATKGNRKKLPQCLFNVPRQELELLPYYSRLVATLHNVYPEISEKLIQLLINEFNYLINKKDQTNIESKIRNVRFLGELTKFRICSSKIVLKCLQTCLNHFSHHNIDMACNLFESCGRFLYRSPETHVRTSTLLDTMMRLKNAKNFDSRMETLIENAFYYCKPPERITLKKERKPIENYIRYLIFSYLNKSTIKDVLRKLIKLNWKEHSKYLIKCLLNLKNISYGNLSTISNLIASFASYYPDLQVKIIDGCLFDFYEGLKQNNPSKQQQRVMNVKFIGELYSFCVIDTFLIFNLLYTLISYPNENNENDSFRIRLICTLISTCAPYFGSASDKRKFSRFLVYFQCYYFSIEFIPYEVEFVMADTLGSLPKQYKRLKTPEDAHKALYNVRQANQQRNVVPFSLNRLSITFEGSADAIEEDVNDILEEQQQINPNQSQTKQQQQTRTNSSQQQHNKNLNSDDLSKSDERNDDDEFDQLFNQMVRESLSSRKSDNLPNSTNIGNMAVPMNLYRSNSSSSNKSNDNDSSNPPPPTRTFRLLMKKGNKQTTCNLEVPSESPFANRQRDSEWEEEQRVVKRKVLEYEAQEAEDDLLGLFYSYFSCTCKMMIFY